MNKEKSTEENRQIEWVKQAQQKDVDAFTKLYEQFSKELYQSACYYLHNQQDAEDAVSEAVLRAYENRHTLRRQDSFKPWIMQITANEARKIYGKNKRFTPVEDMEACMPSFQDEKHELWDVVMELKSVHREVIVLYFYERFTVKEISAVLRVPEGTVKSRLSRGKKQLRKALER